MSESFGGESMDENQEVKQQSEVSEFEAVILSLSLMVFLLIGILLLYKAG